MAIDQIPSTSPTDASPMAAIDNEFPTYRAISSLSILSLLLGLGSVFCFTSGWFLLLVAASTLTGLLAIRKIRLLPDVLTGVGYARVGIGLGLLFGLSSITQSVVEDVMFTLEASSFAKHYVEVIKDQPISMALWYQQKPEYRKTKSADEIADELKQMKSTPLSPDPYKDKTAGLQKMKDRIQSPGESIKFAKIETKAIDGLTVYANALIELDGPGSKDHPEKEQFAMVQLLKGPDGGPDDWVVQEVRFPYTPASAVATVEKKTSDDGHGH